LIVERNTPLFRMVETKQVSTLPLNTEAEMYSVTMDCLRGAGFEHYEISNYAKPGFRSRHNCNYWNHSNYIGFGPSAHSFWGGKRWWNSSNINTYCDKISEGVVPVSGEELLTQTQCIDEAIMLGLRSDGIRLKRLKSSYGIDLLQDSLMIEGLISERLAIVDDDAFRLTDKGYLLCDEITQRLLAGLTVV
jgi:oxygen-independent coproporphyrinogen-3 oxidase